MSGVYLVTWTVLYFQLYTHRSVEHSKASRYFQTVAELRFSVHDLCPSKPCPFAQIKIDASAHARILRLLLHIHAFMSSVQGFVRHSVELIFEVGCRLLKADG